ncbi:hypothetical protein CHARACLAT_000189 [Characodon lateralis]|uniref:Uncharacterized protein n=1 Tax=Characodon lateralis TaxID=208331 RepID=A0ABU7EZ14_9TELE|nr:hypothetical protein [Characodon lateralis]
MPWAPPGGAGGGVWGEGHLGVSAESAARPDPVLDKAEDDEYDWQLPGNSRLLNQGRARTEASGQPSFAHPGSDSLYLWRPDCIYLGYDQSLSC